MSSSNLKNLRDFDVTGGQNLPFPIDFARGPYHSAALPAGGQEKHIINNETIHLTKKIINTLWTGLCGDDPLATVRLPRRSLSSQSLGKY